MKITLSDQTPKSLDAVFILIPEKKWSTALEKSFGKFLSKAVVTEIKARQKSADFSGKFKEITPIYDADKKIATKIYLVGLGKDISKKKIQRAAGVAIRQAVKDKATKVGFIANSETSVAAVAKGANLGHYTFKLGDTSEQFKVKATTIFSSSAESKPNKNSSELRAEKITASEFNSAVAVTEAMNFTRDLINLPTNHMTPAILADEAKKLGKGLRNPIKVTVWGQKQIEKMKMGGVLGVNQGSAGEPKVVIFEYYGAKKKSDAPLGLVGKGVCFDSGGYNLKPTGHIETMKCDMGGAATVLGLFHWIKAVKPKQNIVGIIGAVENMVSATAYRPGDILTMMNGQTCKITNTDAEGRLVLADCIHHMVTKYKPRKLVDFATLTGACIAALGNNTTGVMGNDQKFIETIKKSAEKTEEQVWQLPLTDEFRENIKETECDIQNWTSGVKAGASMAAAFLDNFVGKDTSWVHCDIAGTAFDEKSGTELHPKGGTGAMIQTIADWIESQ